MTGIHRRRARQTTDEQYAKMIGRMLRAWKPRAENDPLAALAHLREYQQLLDDTANTAIHRALSDPRQSRLSASALASAFGISRQAIYKRAALAEQETQAQHVTLRKAAPRELETGAE